VFLAQRQGAACPVAPHDAGTPLLAEAAQQILADPRYRDNARRIQAIFASAHGASAAAGAILGLLDDHRRNAEGRDQAAQAGP
jgi:UDP:flavonoid glycosyltransferase YjiC (YdhE family)